MNGLRIVGVQILLAFLVFFVLTNSSPPKAKAQGSQERPNIIYILTDDQHRSTFKHMDRLQQRVADKGTTYKNFTYAYPLCCPSRATIQRGQYAHNTEVTLNSLPNGGWPAFHERRLEESTGATWIKDAGYKTAYVGKYLNHYDGEVIPPGFNYWFVGAQSSAHLPPRDLGNSVRDYFVNGQGGQRQAYMDEHDEIVANNSLWWLDRHLSKEEPLFLTSAFFAPHPPSYYPESSKDEYKDAQVPRTPDFDEEKLTDQEIRQVDYQYGNMLRSLDRIDAYIEDVAQTLRRHGELRNTYIVYTTDNGIHLGERGRTYGKVQPYQTDVDSQMYVRGPSVPENRISGRLVSNADIAPTFAKIAGGEIPDFVDGRSFLSNRGRNTVFSERVGTENNWAYVRDHHYGYIEFNSGKTEMYNLREDPYQQRDLIKNGEAPPLIREQFAAKLEGWKDCSAEECRIIENQAIQQLQE